MDERIGHNVAQNLPAGIKKWAHEIQLIMITFGVVIVWSLLNLLGWL